MATVIDSLLVKLGLDTSDYDKGRKKVSDAQKGLGNEAKATGKKVKDAGKEGASGFSDMAKEATKFLAVLGGTAVIKNFIQDTIESSSAVERFSRNLGSSVETVSAWGNAAEVAGGSAEGLQGTMDMLSKSQTELQLTGQSGLIPYLSALGVSMADLNGNARPVNDMLLDMADKFSGMDRRTANNLGQMMGIDPGTMNLLLQGRIAVEAMIASQKELGVVTKEQAESAERFRQQTVLFKQEMNATGRDLVANLIPVLEKLFSIFDGLGKWIRDNQTFVQTFLTILAVGLGAVGLAAIPINLTVVAFVALAAAMAALYDDYKTFKNGGDSAMPWDYWIPKLEKAYEWLTKVKDKINEYGYNIATKIFGTVGAGIAAYNGDKKGMQAAYDGGRGVYQKPIAASADGGGDLSAKLAAAEKANGLPAGLLSSIRQQETGGNQAYIDDPSKYHYGLNSEGKRIAGHTGKVSTAFGPFGLLESTARDPGYGVAPLKDKSLDEQIRFAAEYAAARGRSAGSLEAGMAGYGEGGAYSRSVMGRLSGIPGAGQAGAGSATAGSSVGGSRTVTVGEVKIYTQANDAEGIARDMAGALAQQDYLAVSQANSGQM